MKVTILDNETEFLHKSFGITEQRVKYLSKIVSNSMNTDKSAAKTLLLLSEICENANEFAFMCYSFGYNSCVNEQEQLKKAVLKGLFNSLNRDGNEGH